MHDFNAVDGGVDFGGGDLGAVHVDEDTVVATLTVKLRLFYGRSTVVLIGSTCPAIPVATVVLRALDRVCGGAPWSDLSIYF